MIRLSKALQIIEDYNEAVRLVRQTDIYIEEEQCRQRQIKHKLDHHIHEKIQQMLDVKLMEERLRAIGLDATAPKL